MFVWNNLFLCQLLCSFSLISFFFLHHSPRIFDFDLQRLLFFAHGHQWLCCNDVRNGLGINDMRKFFSILSKIFLFTSTRGQGLKCCCQYYKQRCEIADWDFPLRQNQFHFKLDFSISVYYIFLQVNSIGKPYSQSCFVSSEDLFFKEEWGFFVIPFFLYLSKLFCWMMNLILQQDSKTLVYKNALWRR